MEFTDVLIARMLAEVVRLQRWAGGDSVPAARIYGLMHGFESTIRQEYESHGISREMQDHVEDILQDVDNGKLRPDRHSIRNRLDRVRIDETDARTVMRLCQLESRFGEAIKKIAEEAGGDFSLLKEFRAPEQNWFGALFYMELVDCTEGARKKLHSVMAPAIPRVGETVTPPHGSTMEVVGVDYVMASQGEGEGIQQMYLVPYVLLEAIDDDDEAGGEEMPSESPEPSIGKEQ